VTPYRVRVIDSGFQDGTAETVEISTITGPQGYQGNTGSAGSAGIQGPQGYQGAEGAGYQGYQGYQGPQGVQDVRFDWPNNQVGVQYVIQTSDAGKTIWMNNASENNVFLPDNAIDPIPVNTTVIIVQEGAGQTNVRGTQAATTLNGVQGGVQSIANQYGPATVIKRSVNEWVTWGDFQ